MRYRENTPLVLDGLNLNIQSGQTVGIVGRTGSGEDGLPLSFFPVVFFAFPLGLPVELCRRVGWWWWWCVRVCVCVCARVCVRVRVCVCGADWLYLPLKPLYCKLGFQVERVCGVGSKHTLVLN